jgi:GNAT superfamily N-acetyltransferase
MILLDSENYYKLKQPLKSVEINHLFARTVVEQKMDGEIYVDDLNNPSTFYVKHSYGMALLFGNTHNEFFNKQLTSYLLNEESKRHAGEWLQVFPSEWNDKLEELLTGHFAAESTVNPSELHRIIKSTRVNFRFNKSKYTSAKHTISPDFKLVRTDANLFGQITGTVVPRYLWRNKDEFSQNAVGFSLIYRNEPVSTAFASFIHDRQLELGIETQAQFHGKGLAQLTCSALIDYCLENNFEPVWACRLENTGSFQLAQKLGFEPVRMIPYYQLPF